MASEFTDWSVAKLEQYAERIKRLRFMFVENQDFTRAAAMRDREELIKAELKTRPRAK